jgi:hypothetical protein
MERKENLWEKEFWTQKEVADYFRVSQNTIIKWRRSGFLGFIRPPESPRVLYYRDDIEQFKQTNTTVKKGGDKRKTISETERKKPDISATPGKKWRI